MYSMLIADMDIRLWDRSRFRKCVHCDVVAAPLSRKGRVPLLTQVSKFCCLLSHTVVCPTLLSRILCRCKECLVNTGEYILGVSAALVEGRIQKTQQPIDH
ncbi:hypothetical protein IG631_00021 [Alternaria alternata]|nr:hypothetical protein IG631_00021 [Alternaria alternata]